MGWKARGCPLAPPGHRGEALGPAVTFPNQSAAPGSTKPPRCFSLQHQAEAVRVLPVCSDEVLAVSCNPKQCWEKSGKSERKGKPLTPQGPAASRRASVELDKTLSQQPTTQGPSEWHQTAQAALVDGAAEPPTTLQPLSDLRRRQEELPGFLC